MQERVKSKKLAMTVEIDAALAAAAAAKGIDISMELERALRRSLGTGQSTLNDEERAALEWSERYVAEHGRWDEGLEKL